MKTTVRTQGFAQMDAALGEFSKATGKNILKRAGVAALQDFVSAAKARAPVQAGGDADLRESIAASTKLNKRQKRLNRNPDVVEAYAGPAGQGGEGAPPQGVFQEFGTEDHSPQPFMRPAWDAEKAGVLTSLSSDLADQIEAARARARRKALKAAR